MYLTDNGFWSPDGFKGDTYMSPILLNGMPGRDLAVIRECLDLCGLRRRKAVDAGAFMGAWSLHLLRHFNHVISLEPIEENFHCLSRNMNSRLAHGARATSTLMNKTLSNTNDPLVLELGDPPRPFSWQAVKSFFVPKEDKKGPLVKAVTLDSLELEEVDFLRLNVGNYAHDAIRGALKTIGRCTPTILVEGDRGDDDDASHELLIMIGMSLEVQMGKTKRIYTW